MFVDRAKIYVKSGDGGDGALSFRREKYIPKGGPDGGDGGDGGSVIMEVDTQLTTLLDFSYNLRYIAENGRPGEGGKRSGKSGENLIVRIPPGTIIYDDDSGDVLADMVEDGQTFIVVKGGTGGKGNTKFATATRQVPRIYEEGTEGEEKNLRLELKLIADAGLVGLPNAGKSTILSVLTRATPKIAGYPFTTMSPYLGIASLGEERQLVLADIPGLIEGAHQGRGLGDEFLRHVERTRFLIHVVDMNPYDGSDPVENYNIINNELSQYSPELGKRPQIIAANKMDLPDSEAYLEFFEEETGKKCYPISALAKNGLKELLEAIYTMKQNLDEEEEKEKSNEEE